MTELAEKQAAPGRLADGLHIYPIRIFYEDTDAAGLVYYANYLKFAERARTEMMRQVGIHHSALRAADGTAFIVRHCAVDYRLPARLDDLIEVHTRIVRLSGAAIEAEQIAKRDGVDLVRMRLKLACIDAAGRPIRLPQVLRAALESLQSEGART